MTGDPMTCDPRRLVAFVSGELSGDDERYFENHLLTCEACSKAVHEDRLGRLAVERLRSPAPAGLAERITLTIGLAQVPDRPEPKVVPHRFSAGSRRTKRLVAAVALTTALAAGVLGWALVDRTETDPPQIARVAAMMAPGIVDGSGLRGGEHFRFGGQDLTVRSYRVDGGPVLVATSSRPFPMPTHTEHLGGSSAHRWGKTQGRLALYGVNRPTPAASMFVVAAMPMAELPQVVARLHLV